jgi:hypothetical protein
MVKQTSATRKRAARKGLAQFHDKRIAVILPIKGQNTACCGIACFGRDDLLGNVLRIRIDAAHGEGNPEILLCEHEWDGDIAGGAEYGCDYCFRPSQLWPPG